VNETFQQIQRMEKKVSGKWWVVSWGFVKKAKIQLLCKLFLYFDASL
jgi:hypothetical protein